MASALRILQQIIGRLCSIEDAAANRHLEISEHATTTDGHTFLVYELKKGDVGFLWSYCVNPNLELVRDERTLKEEESIEAEACIHFFRRIGDDHVRSFILAYYDPATDAWHLDPDEELVDMFKELGTPASIVYQALANAIRNDCIQLTDFNHLIDLIFLFFVGSPQMASVAAC